jgi:acyl-coenzyme A thioesterase PaaI-like protein
MEATKSSSSTDSLKKDHDEQVLRNLRPNAEEYERLDEKHLSEGAGASIFSGEEWRRDHAIHGLLAFHPNGIEMYEIYKSKLNGDIIAVIGFGSQLNGYPGIVHGGITSLMFDNTYGWLLLTTPAVGSAFTANLSVNYRKPIMPNSLAILRTKMSKVEERKIFMEATMHDAENQLLADSTTLFIKMRTPLPVAPAAGN